MELKRATSRAVQNEIHINGNSFSLNANVGKLSITFSIKKIRK